MLRTEKFIFGLPDYAEVTAVRSSFAASASERTATGSAALRQSNFAAS